VAKKRRKQSAAVKTEAGRPQNLRIPSSEQGGGLREVTCILLIILAGIWAYSNSLNDVFVLDDVRAIVQNETIRSLTPLSFSPPGRSTVAGRPLSNFTFAVNYAISELNVRSYHVINVLIHLSCALAVFGVVRRTLQSERLRERLGVAATPVAGAAALIWVVHPLTTSAVTYIVQRVESLMSLFYLLTLYCAIRASEDANARTKRAWTAASIVSCAFGMATKEVMVTAPIGVALWDFVFRQRKRIRWGLFAGLAATWIVFGVLVATEFRTPSVGTSGDVVWRYLLTQAEVITRYLRLAVVPSPLIFLYSWPLVSSLRDVLPEMMMISVLIALTLFGLWRRQPLAYGAAMFFLVLAPTSSVIPIITEIAAEHRMYLPLAILIATIVASAYVVLQRYLSPRTLRVAASILTVVIVLLLGTTTRARNLDYRSEQQLWADTVGKDPRNQRARVAYGSVLAQAGRLADAEIQFRRATELNDADPIAHARLGSVLAAQGKVDDALTQLTRAIALNDSDVDAHRMLGQLLAMQRKDAGAIAHLERALQAEPDSPQLLVQVASVRADSRDPSVRDISRAVALAEHAVELTSRREATALDVLGLAYARQGRFAEAVSAAQDALAIAKASGNTAAAESIESRLRVYRAQIKY
jgi:tetratricopeptide (TPR) repeat protein